jgi:hypothetical protein
MSKEKIPTIKVNWKLAIYALVGLIIGSAILVFAYLNFPK